MPRQGRRGAIMEGRLVTTKIRKRGCSSSSSTSSRVHNYRLNKRAILVGKNRAGVGIRHGGSRSTTPVPVWRTTPLRSGIESPKYSHSAKSTQPVSARRLAATLWGLNDMPSPKMSEINLEMKRQYRKMDGVKTASKREKMQSEWGLHLGSRYLPPHLSDPSHSPTISEVGCWYFAFDALMYVNLIWMFVSGRFISVENNIVACKVICSVVMLQVPAHFPLDSGPHYNFISVSGFKWKN